MKNINPRASERKGIPCGGTCLDRRRECFRALCWGTDQRNAMSLWWPNRSSAPRLLLFPPNPWSTRRTTTPQPNLSLKQKSEWRKQKTENKRDKRNLYHVCTEGEKTELRWWKTKSCYCENLTFFSFYSIYSVEIKTSIIWFNF